MRRDPRLQQRRTIFSPGSLSLPSAKPALLANKAGIDEHAPEWLVHEDWALLQVRCAESWAVQVRPARSLCVMK